MTTTTKTTKAKLPRGTMGAKVIWLDPTEVSLGWRAREHSGDINQLVGSIGKEDQIQPIAVRKTSNGKPGYELIAGMRRLQACERLGRKVAAVLVRGGDEEKSFRQQLAENLQRKGFDELELGEGLAHWKTLYEARHPETKHGAVGGGRGGKGVKTKTGVSGSATPVDRFTVEAARLLGVSEAKVRELLKVAEIPKREKKHCAAAPTTTERNRRVRSAVTRVRRNDRLERLQQAADAARKEREEKEEQAGIAKSRIVCHVMDCRQWAKSAHRGQFDLILADPQYDLDWSTIGHVDRASVGETVLWDKLDLGWVRDIAPLAAKDATIFAFCSAEMIGFYKLAFAAIGWEYKTAYFWLKTNPGTVYRGGEHLSAVEAAVIATRGKPHFEPFENAGSEEARNYTTGPICGGSERLDHPTQKPEWLIKEIMLRHSFEDARILDPFAGVGTTPAVAMKTGRRCVAIELEPKYAEQMKIRLEAIK
jgi:DNA modification methylase/uncharacterized ParB-like nuclease family protein